ncbi:hypothetical protein CA13_14210 [Planctomycetes bacterium CA13]|uniref:Uncharacterized protein n=1 Tax=Novipirellula herctigrandis TaxID=2527986 RepID=A0A5C5YY35_9BACT|nr:hypothetical protein CA13_14210 [Planctomycetes bacterium CA13]
MRTPTRFDKRYLLLVGSPVCILAALFVISLGSAWINQRKLDRDLHLVTGLDDATAPDAFAVWYESHSSKERTLDWREVETASLAISYLANPFLRDSEDRAGTLIPPDEHWPSEDRNYKLVALAKPLVDRLKAMPMPAEPVWHPLHYESFANHYPIAEMPAPLMTVLWPEIRAAYHEGDTPRAITAIRLYIDLFGPKSERSVQQPCFTSFSLHRAIRDSLSDDVWSPADLTELQQLLTPEYDWRQLWEGQLSRDALIVSPWLQDSWRHKRFARNTRVGSKNTDHLDVNHSTWVPSDSFDVVQKFAAARQIDSEPGTAAFQGAASELLGDRSNSPPWILPSSFAFRLDQWLKLPFMPRSRSDLNSRSHLPGDAQSLVLYAVDRRFTRTAIAVKQYQIKFDKWPQSLNQLSQVSLPVAQTIGSEGKPFFYRVNRDTNTVKLGKLPNERKVATETNTGDLSATVIEIS